MDRFRQAWYWPADEDDQVLRLSDSRPCIASVISSTDSSADLQVTDHFGRVCIRRDVPYAFHAGSDRCELVA